MNGPAQRFRTAAAAAYLLCLLAGCGEGSSSDERTTHGAVRGPRGYVELSCPDDVAFRIAPGNQSADLFDPGADVESWVHGHLVGSNVVRRFVLPPGVASFVAKPETRSASDVTLERRSRPARGMRFEVLVVEGFTTRVVVCPSDEAQGGFAVTASRLVPGAPTPAEATAPARSDD